MRRPLILIAASGLAREVAEAVRAGSSHQVVGFVDDDESLWGRSVAGAPVLGGMETLVDWPDADLLLCVGRGAARAALAVRVHSMGIGQDRYATIVHPSVHVPRSCRIGMGSILLAGACLTADVSIGRHVVVMPRVVLTHDDDVADYVTLCAGVTLGGGVHVRTAAYLAMSCSVRENVTVGAGAIVGMGAIVLQDVPANQTWIGAPARSRLHMIGAVAGRA